MTAGQRMKQSYRLARNASGRRPQVVLCQNGSSLVHFLRTILVLVLIGVVGIQQGIDDDTAQRLGRSTGQNWHVPRSGSGSVRNVPRSLSFSLSRSLWLDVVLISGCWEGGRLHVNGEQTILADML